VIFRKERLEMKAAEMISILFVFLHNLLLWRLNYCKEVLSLTSHYTLYGRVV